MNRKTYNEYIKLFNARDYDGFLSYFSDTFEANFLGGLSFYNRKEIKDFYSFLHEYINEEVCIERYVSDDHMIAMEVVVKFTGKKNLTKEIAKERGYPDVFPLKEGELVELPQYIHYYLEDGKITALKCVIS